MKEPRELIRDFMKLAGGRGDDPSTSLMTSESDAVAELQDALMARPEFAYRLHELTTEISTLVACALINDADADTLRILSVSGLFLNPSQSVMSSLLRRLSPREPFLYKVASHLLNAERMDLFKGEIDSNNYLPLLSALCQFVEKGAGSNSLSIFISFLQTQKFDEKNVREILSENLSAELLAQVQPEVVRDRTGELEFAKLSKSLNARYNTGIARKLVNLIFKWPDVEASQICVTTLSSIMNDESFSDAEKSTIICQLDAAAIEELVLVSSPRTEELCLSLAHVWPTTEISVSQLGILNKLALDERSIRVQELFIRSVKEGDVILTPSTLTGITNEPLYGSIMKAIGDVVRKEGRKSFISDSTIDAILEARRQPLPAEFFYLLLRFDRDWTKLEIELQAKFIDYCAVERPQNFVLKKVAAESSVIFNNRIVATITETVVDLLPQLSTVSGLTKALIEKVARLNPTQPKDFKGDFYLANNQFRSTTAGIDAAMFEVVIDFDADSILRLKRISGSIVIRGLNARRKGTQGTAVYVVEMGHQDILAELAKTRQVIDKAKSVQKKLDRVKKDTARLLESMSTISQCDDRKFGVELEIASSVSRTVLARKLGRGTKASDDNHSDGWNEWSIKFDRSVGGESVLEEDGERVLSESEHLQILESGGYSAELVSPVLRGRDGLAELKRVLSRLNRIVKSGDAELRVGEAVSTGLHVHHSIEDLIERVGEIEVNSEIALEMGKFLITVQGALYALCSNWRRGSTYSRPLRSPDEIKGDFRHGFAISAYGTLEFRLKEATFNVEEILRWVVLTQQVTVSLIESVNRNIESSRKSLEEALSGGLDLVIAREFGNDPSLSGDILQHLAYYQAATDFALAA